MSQPENLSDIIAGLLRQLPQWIRFDLSSKDSALRERAEDALAAMLANAIGGARDVTISEPRRH